MSNEVGEGPMYVLSDKLIDVTTPEGTNLEEIILNGYKRLKWTVKWCDLNEPTDFYMTITLEMVFKVAGVFHVS